MLRLPSKEFIVDRVARGETARSPSQKLPSTAIYCHFGAAKPLRPFQPFYWLPIEGMTASLTVVIFSSRRGIACQEFQDRCILNGQSVNSLAPDDDLRLWRWARVGGAQG